MTNIKRLQTEIQLESMRLLSTGIILSHIGGTDDLEIWTHSRFLTVHKGKGQKTECSNYRPITLLSVPWKVFAHVLLAHLDPLFHSSCRPHQSGFTRSRSTLDAILALKLLSELHREFQKPLHVAYVDLKSAFDYVDRKALWLALKGKGIPPLLQSRRIIQWNFSQN